jgi:branched-chain amino acid transport system ATP-binding protein
VTASLLARDLVAGYDPEVPVVRGVSLQVETGEIVALLGPNGAGKSTLARALAGLVPVFSGSAALRGQEIVGLPAHRLARAGMGFVPQTDNVFTELSVRENLDLAAAILPRRRRAERIAAMLALFADLAPASGKRAGALSGGQRQMLAIARALIPAPHVLMLDEPSAGLSPKMAAAVFAALARIRATGVSMLLVEQNTRAALRLADRALVLVRGRVAHQAPAVSLASRADLADLFLDLA